jgi:RNA polymerase sigma-70 factor (ECF subfamily)
MQTGHERAPSDERRAGSCARPTGRVLDRLVLTRGRPPLFPARMRQASNPSAAYSLSSPNHPDPSVKPRTNAEWLSALNAGGEIQGAALSELRAYLVRVAAYALRRYHGVPGQAASGDVAPLAEDSAQDALSALLEHLHEFRGDSRFTTWAYKFAVHAALVAVRREGWARRSLDSLLEGPDLVDRVDRAAGMESDPQRRALQAELLAALRDAIETELTTRQRQALTAIVFDEVPLDELARHWGSNRNALYKLLHDARRKLKARLATRGYDVQEMLNAFGQDR